MTQETLLLLSAVILLLPLLAFVLIIFNQGRLGRMAGYFGTGFLGVNLLLSIIVAAVKLTTYSDAGMLQMRFDWFDLGTHSITIGIGLDNLASIMLIVVNLISFLVHLFSLEYMREDKRFPRFYAYLGFFTFSMLGIVIANNFLNMYIFWELVGVSSYLLIGFWYEKDSAANANKKAFIMNRIGDLGFFAGIMILFFTYGTFMFDDIFANIGDGNIPFDSGTMLTIAGILLFMGAIGKSAQFPLHTWLPDAMEGPTPVSALIHAATMVAAGVYLTARIFPMLTADALLFIAYTGAITAFIAATIAITQNDFKKVLAYSTVSQLGYMVMAIGVGAFTYGFFHLVTHAWFKACLFLGSGSVIHAMHHSMHHAHNHTMDPQDIRNMGGLRKTMPWTYATFLFSTIAIAGVPFTSGFLSKDGILAGTLAFGTLSGHWLIPLAGFAAAGMTAFYMFRLLIVSFHGRPKTDIAAHTHENNKFITIPLVLLSVITLWGFYSLNPLDASGGWFYSKIKAPPTVVQAEYQWDFLVPYEKAASDVCCPGHAHTHHSHSDVKSGSCCDHKNDDCCSKSVVSKEKTTCCDKCSEECFKITDTEERAKCCENCTADCCSIAAKYSEMLDDEIHRGLKAGMHGEMPDDDIHAAFKNNAAANDNHHHGEEVAHNQQVMHKFEDESHKQHLPAMILSLLIAGAGIFISFTFYQFKIFSPDHFADMVSLAYKLSYNKWYFDEIYDATAVWGTIVISRILSWFDLNVVDGIVNLIGWISKGIGHLIGLFDNIVIDGFVNLTASVTGFFGIVLRKFQTGRVQAYMVLTIIGLMLLLYFVI